MTTSTAPGTAPGERSTTPGAAPGERGTTTVADRAVRRIAQRAAREALPAGRAEVTSGSATVHGRRAEVSLDVTLPYPVPLRSSGARLQQHVTDRTTELTGLDVSPAAIRVTTLAPSSRGARESKDPRESEALGADVEGHALSPGRRPSRRRPWAQRRVPVAVLTLVAASGCGLLLYDVVAVHALGRPPAPWRTGLLDRLSTYGPGDTAVVVTGAASALFGAVLLLLALTPGHRRRLPLTSSEPGVRAVLDRRSAALLVRDAVAAVPGVSETRVRSARGRIVARARLSFGDRATARRAVREAAAAALAGCGLGRPPRLRTRVRPGPHWHEQRPEGDSGSDEQPSEGDPGSDEQQPDGEPGSDEPQGERP